MSDREFFDVVTGLWDSFADDALTANPWFWLVTSTRSVRLSSTG